ncbi:MAG: AtpZ/AtpI family protein [Geminicoccales bacterium]
MKGHPSKQGKSNHVADEIGQKADRKLRARQRPKVSTWFGLGMFGLVGWSIAVPTVAGIALGIWLDTKLDTRMSWTLTLLFVGVVLGSLNAWYWMKQESEGED